MHSEPNPWYKRVSVIDLAAFLITAFLVHLFTWDVKELIWGIWLSSLSCTLVLVVLVVFSNARSKDSGHWVSRIIVAYLAGNVLWGALGGFHVGYALALHEFFPLVAESQVGVRDDFEAVVSMKKAALLFWPFAVVTLIARFKDLVMGVIRGNSADQVAEEIGERLGQMVTHVIVMHLMIFVFAILQFTELSHLAIYPVLAAFFFPWGSLFKKKTANQDSASGPFDLKGAD